MSQEAQTAFDPWDLPEYPTYLDMLGRDLPPPLSSIDLIVVPAGREAHHIDRAANLAKAAGTRLLAVCSKQASAAAVADRLSNTLTTEWYAVDLPEGFSHPLLEFQASQVAQENNPTSRQSDLSRKRAIGTLCPGKKLFLDDDIELTPEAMQEMGLLLGDYDMAGTHYTGFPDKSVVNHALSALRHHHLGRQGRSYTNAGNISGNCLAVGPGVRSHTPEIYNEDWMFAYDYVGRQRVSIAPTTARQARYYPFSSPDRAASEEFGDIIIQGLYDGLKQNTGPFFDTEYWTGVISERRHFIEQLLTATDQPSRWDRVTASGRHGKKVNDYDAIRQSLEAALDTNQRITAESCQLFVKLWRQDEADWQERLDAAPDHRSVGSVLGYLGLSGHTLSLH